GQAAPVTLKSVVATAEESFAKTFTFALLAIGLLLGGHWLDSSVQGSRHAEVVTAPIVLPAVDGWERGGEWADLSAPVLVGADEEAAEWYERGSERIGVFVAHYAVQRQGREAVYYANYPLGRVDFESPETRSVVS